MVDNECVYVTVLSNEDFLPGVKALLKSMKRVHCVYPLAIMIPESLQTVLAQAINSRGLLESYNAFIVVVPDLEMPDTVEIDTSHHWANTFFKLKSTSLTQYKKIILIDCDVIVLRNMDELFQRQSMSATTAGVCVHPEWKGCFSSGLVVIEPNLKLHESLLSSIEPAVKRLYSIGQRAGDQDVFQTAFPDWADHEELLIHEKYNVIWYAIPHFCKYYQLTTKDIFMVHFTGATKPWGYDKNYARRIMFEELRTQFSVHDWVRIPFRKAKQKKLFNLLFKAYIWKKYWKLCR